MGLHGTHARRCFRWPRGPSWGPLGRLWPSWAALGAKLVKLPWPLHGFCTVSYTHLRAHETGAYL
eukprot:7401088-Pyramimonas_sp.AAC.1